MILDTNALSAFIDGEPTVGVRLSAESQVAIGWSTCPITVKIFERRLSPPLIREHPMPSRGPKLDEIDVR